MKRPKNKQKWQYWRRQSWVNRVTWVVAVGGRNVCGSSACATCILDEGRGRPKVGPVS